MTLPNQLLLFYVLTNLGSSFSAIASFLLIDPSFGSVSLLGLALSLRTLAILISSYQLNWVFRVLGARRTFVFSQLLGVLAIAVVWFGFQTKVYSWVLFGIVLGGLPVSVLSAGLVSAFRITLSDSMRFRRFSGFREMAMGGAQIIAGLSVPLILKEYGDSAGFGVIVVADIISYVLALGLLKRMDFKEVDRTGVSGPPVPNAQLCKTREFIHFACLTGGPLLLVGFYRSWRAHRGQKQRWGGGLKCRSCSGNLFGL